MRVVAAVFVPLLLSAVAPAQSFQWLQSPATGNLYAVTSPLTWQQARNQALALGGDLAVVRSAEEQAFLFDAFGGGQCLWIGYTDAAVEGTWVWASGSTASYTNWAPGQPDNQGGAENWAALSPQNGWPLGAGGRWLDLGANFVCPGIIELEPAAAGRVTALGAGCAGTNGVPELTAFAAAPVPGSFFPVRIDRLPQVPTVVLAGLGLPGGPIDLSTFGMPGCTFYLDTFFVTVLGQPTSSGSLNWSFLVLNSPVLRGVQIRAQAAVIDPPANVRGATMTNALAMIYGQAVGTVALDERFLDDGSLDRARSGGSWGGGAATFAAIGGDGRHGIFRAEELGQYLGQIGALDTYVIDTDNTTIPAANTLSGTQLVVSDGRFFFEEMVVPASVRLRFVGSSPPVFTVAGRIEILGEIDAQGESVSYPSTTTAPIGQTGGAGGVFGGAGGKGGDKCLGNGAAAAHQGQDGESAHVFAAHAYAATAIGTGGRGSTLFPASGLSSALFFAPGVVTYTPDASAGGGGGGLWTTGQQGRVVFNNHIDPILGVPPRLSSMGPPAAGGTALQFFPFPAVSGPNISSQHFLAGGSGGGGAASNAALAINVVRLWAMGCGGGGGGGAVAFRAGDALDIGGGANVLANGGSAGSILSTIGATASPAPAGGGSGGTVVLQSANTANIMGQVNVLGGLGGAYDRSAGPQPPSGARVQIAGGDGSSGFVRFEQPGAPTPAMLPNAMPPATANNVAPLAERDPLASATSRFLDTRAPLPPQFVRYEIEADVDGVPVLFSDDPTVSGIRADIGAPLQAYFQAAAIDPNSPQPQPAGPWRTAVRSGLGATGIDEDTGTLVRFRIVHDRALANTVVVKRVQVVYRL